MCYIFCDCMCAYNWYPKLLNLNSLTLIQLNCSGTVKHSIANYQLCKLDTDELLLDGPIRQSVASDKYDT